MQLLILCTRKTLTYVIRTKSNFCLSECLPNNQSFINEAANQ